MSFTTEDDVSKIIAKDYEDFYKEKFDGPLPTDLIEMFKKSLMIIPPHQHEIKMNTVRDIINKRYDELNTLEVGIVVTLITKIPFEKLYPDLDTAMNYFVSFELLMIEYNKQVSEFSVKMRRKREALMNMIQKTASLKPIKS